MKTTELNGVLFAHMVLGAAANLNQNRTIVNDLNVFPIPDGDTGDNMFMTIDSGAHAVADVTGTSQNNDSTDGGDCSIAEISSRIARGMLLGARGNSGVILSRIFSGIARGFADAVTADVKKLGSAFEVGIQEAYKAVSVPVEGTILTVYRDAVTYANSMITDGCTVEGYFDNLMKELRLSLEKTPEFLDVLRDAGVVDSGGAGFVYIAEGMLKVLRGEIAAEGNTNSPSDQSHPIDTSLFNEDSILEFGYCTEFLLQLQNSKTDVKNFDEKPLIDHLNSIGESVVAFREGSIIKVHIHTMHPGDVLNYCQQFGEFLTLKVENMTLQHNNTTVENRYEAPRSKRHKAYGIVAVATGKGIVDTFTALGVDSVVDGGQSMNPSTDDFIRAFEDINADTILVFPNNGNVILTAKQAAALYDKADIRVIPCKTVGEGYVAISMLDTSSGDTDAIVSMTEEVVADVVCGSVSRANRNTVMNGISVQSGDYIGFSDDVVYSDSASRRHALLELAESLNAGKYDILMLICGKEATDDEARGIYDELNSKYRSTEIIMIDGGQPIFDYMLVLE